MSNLSRRNKLIIGVVGGLLVVGAIAIAIGPPPESERSEPSTVADVVAGSGAETIEIVDAVHDRPITMSYWEPSGDDRSHLVVLSHGFGGDRTSHDYLAEELVSQGYTVVAPTHPDTAGLESGDGELDPLVLRPRHLSLAIDAAEVQHRTTEPFDDVSVIGHSLGGYSALRLVGVSPDSSEIENYCSENGEDPILCTAQAQARFLDLTVRDALGADARVDRIALMAPGYGPLFAAEALAVIDVPVQLLEASDDREVAANQIDDLMSGLPEGTQSHTIDGGHFDFVRTCTADESAALPELCSSEDGVDREDVHEQLVDLVSGFLAG